MIKLNIGDRIKAVNHPINIDYIFVEDSKWWTVIGIDKTMDCYILLQKTSKITKYVRTNDIDQYIFKPDFHDIQPHFKIKRGETNEPRKN